MHFNTRAHAGKLLAKTLATFLSKKYPGIDAVIYALPRGGVPLGFEIALALNMPLDLIIPRKIGHPLNSEYAIGAVTENGDTVCNETELAKLDSDWFEQECKEEMADAKRRRECYLNEREPVTVKGKLAILVDDGIATGLTMRAAIRDLKNQQPDKIIVAIPVISSDTDKLLSNEVDDVVAQFIDSHYQGSVGSYYQYFYQLADEEVMRLLNQLDENNRPIV